MDGDLNDPVKDEPRKEANVPQKSEKTSKNANGNLKQHTGENGTVKCESGELQFREKVFIERPALLEKYFDLDNGQSVTLFNFIVAMFILAIMGTWAHDYHRHKNPFHHLWLVRWNFAQLPETMLLWTAMFLSTIAIPFYGLKLWARFGPGWGSAVCVCAYICYQFAFFYYSLRALFWLQLRGACSFIITCENTRLAMKTHSFVRENFHKAVNARNSGKESSEKEQLKPIKSEQFPTIHQFIYFMFCPSLLYRDSYPRSAQRSWRKVGRHLLGCLSTMYFVSICFSQLVIPLFGRISYPEEANWHFLLFTLFPCVIPGGICLIIGIFYGLLHSWLSMFAEAMQFADRHFYSNWWNSKNMAEYYRNWNLVVHEWLYYYVYRDISLLAGPILAQISVFFISSVFHEYWFGVSLGMFYPVIFTLYFGFGGVFFLVSKLIKRQYVWNILLWWNLHFGCGLFFTCYASEWYARQKCARIYESDLWDLIVPRVWNCHQPL